MRDDPVLERPQINTIPGRLKSMLHRDAVHLQLKYQIRILRLPLGCGITESKVISANHQDGRSGPVCENFGKDANRIGGRVVRTRVVANRFEEITLHHADVAPCSRRRIVTVRSRSAYYNEPRRLAMVDRERNIVQIHGPAERIETDS